MSWHTPGPWRVEFGGNAKHRTVKTYVMAGDGDDGVLVCEVNTDEPDARLIASAPDLLEIAKELAASARLPSGVSFSSRRVTYPAATLHKLRAAITKAEAGQ